MSDDNIFDYKITALSAVKFHLVFAENDLYEKRQMGTFSPKMAHQVFGPGETIFGYKQLAINLYYLHNSSKCFVEIRHLGKVEHIDADDIMQKLDPWLPTNYISTKEDFIQIVKNEKHNQMFGTVIHEFEKYTQDIEIPSRTTVCKYKITQCDQTDPLFQEYHQRFETFITWFIDAANFIDLNDERWLIFYIYEEYIHPTTDEVFITPVGFTTIYKFFSYPSNVRARISQFFILPTHQSRGLGSAFYNTVFKEILKTPEIVDLTVEEPNADFQSLRDVCDGIYLYNDLKKNNPRIDLKFRHNLKKYIAQHKICKRQALKMADVLQYHDARKNNWLEDFLNVLLTKMVLDIEKELGSHKRARAVVSQENLDTKLMLPEQLEQRFLAYKRELEKIADKMDKYL